MRPRDTNQHAGIPNRCALELLEPRLLLSADLPGTLYDMVGADVSDASNLADQATGFRSGEVLVAFQPGTRGRRAEEARQALGAETIKVFSRIGAQHWRLPKGLSVPQAVEALSRNPNVRYAEPNYVHSIAATPNDPDFDQLWGLHNTGQTGGTADADIDALEAWSIATGSGDIVVGVIDSGVDYAHVDLAVNMWTNPGETPDDGIDNDGNGYVDDVYGWDFHNNDNDPMDDRGHGTHCSGTIGAAGNNDTGVVGVNWSVKIMALKFLSAGGSGSTADAIDAVNYATMMRELHDSSGGTLGANIVLTSNSWGGGGFSQALADAIAAGGDKNMLFIASSGNGSTNTDANPYYPAGYDLDNIISVASTDHNDGKASSSNWGAASVDLGAPGVDVFGSLPGDAYGMKSGTSMAAPHVAGAAALTWSLAPAESYATIRDAIFEGVDPNDALRTDGSTPTVTGGRLNALGTLAKVCMVVAGSAPATGDIETAQPTDFAVHFSFPVDDTTLEAGDLTVNGIAADSVTAGDGGLTATFTFDASPVTAEGLQTMHMAAGAVATNSPDPVDPLLKEWNATFRYDSHRMAVASTVPPTDGLTHELPLTSLKVTVDEAYDTASASVDDVILSQGSVVGVDTTLAAEKTVVYTLAGVVDEGTLTVQMPAGALADVSGNPMLPYEGTMDLDFGTVAFPTPLVARPPLGSLIYEGAVSALITQGDTGDTFTLNVDPGQTITVVADPDASLRPTVSLSGEANGSATADAAGEDAVIQTQFAGTGGSHTITVSGADGTTGACTLRVTLNAAAEDENHNGSANDDMASAQTIDASFIVLADGAKRGAACGRLGPMTGTAVHSEDFESGSLGAEWSTYSSTGNGRIQVTGEHGTAGGSYALLMDCEPGGSSNLNEAIWTVDLSGKTKAILNFRYAEWADEQHVFSRDSFRDHLEADGIAIRDGSQRQAKWHPIWNAGNTGAGFWWTSYIDLAAWAAYRGVSLSNSFQIKFQQYDDEALTSDGRGWDNIAILCPEGSTQGKNQDWYKFTLDEPAPVTLALRNWGYADAHVALYGTDGAKLAEGGGSASSVDEMIETTLSPGTYYAMVSGNHFFSTLWEYYSLAVTIGARFDLGTNSGPEPWNGDPFQSLDVSGGAVVLGHASAGRADTLAQARVLYFMDHGYSDPFTQAMANLGVTPTVAASVDDFAAKLAAGGWDLAILLQQGYLGHSWVGPMRDYVRNGGRAIVADWTGSQSVARPFGATYTGNKNGDSITQVAHRIWDGIIDPFDLTNPGYGTFSTGLRATIGQSIGTFPDGDDALVVGNEGRTVLNGFSSDTAKTAAEGVKIAENEIVVVASAEVDFYEVTLSAGDELEAATLTPADGNGGFLNELNPMLRLHNASGDLVRSDDDGGAGRNAHLTYTVPADGAGTYYIEVLASDATAEPTKGEYVLTVDLAEAPGITVEPASGLITTEGGATDTFTVVLNTQPTAAVTIGLSSSDTTEGSVSPTSLTFAASDWATPQTVTVTGVDDTIEDGDAGYTVVLSPASSTDPNYDGLDPVDVSVVNQDNDESTQTFFSTDTPLTIADPHPRKGPKTTTSELEISSGITIASLDIDISIDHADMSELTISLISPSGKEESLWYSGTEWLLVNPTAFDGEPVDGIWTLAVTDSLKGNIGTLLEWSLTVSPLS